MFMTQETGKTATFPCAQCGRRVMHSEWTMIDKEGSRLEWTPMEHDRPDGAACASPKEGFWTLLEELAPSTPEGKVDWTASSEVIATSLDAVADFKVSSEIVEVLLDGTPPPSDFAWTISRTSAGFRFSR